MATSRSFCLGEPFPFNVSFVRVPVVSGLAGDVNHRSTASASTTASSAVAEWYVWGEVGGGDVEDEYEIDTGCMPRSSDRENAISNYKPD